MIILLPEPEATSSRSSHFQHQPISFSEALSYRSPIPLCTLRRALGRCSKQCCDRQESLMCVKFWFHTQDQKRIIITIKSSLCLICYLKNSVKCVNARKVPRDCWKQVKDYTVLNMVGFFFFQCWDGTEGLVHCYAQVPLSAFTSIFECLHSRIRNHSPATQVKKLSDT